MLTLVDACAATGAPNTLCVPSSDVTYLANWHFSLSNKEDKISTSLDARPRDDQSQLSHEIISNYIYIKKKASFGFFLYKILPC